MLLICPHTHFLNFQQQMIVSRQNSTFIVNISQIFTLHLIRRSVLEGEGQHREKKCKSSLLLIAGSDSD